MPLHQGDIIPMLTRIPLFKGDEESLSWQEAPDGVVVISQTCDAIRDSTIQVAPIVQLDDERAEQARVGRRLQYVPLRHHDVMKFADLGHIVTISRDQVDGCQTTDQIETGIADLKDERLFRSLVGHRFSRFPFPDQVTEWCRPLTDTVAPKARHADTKAEGARLNEIKEIRCTVLRNWSQPPFDLQLDFLVEPGVLPEPDRELTSQEKRELNAMSAASLAAKIGELAQPQTVEDEGEATKRLFAWQRLTEQWVESCNHKYSPEKNDGIKVHGNAQVWDLDEYPYSHVLSSERLDLDYLSRS